MFFARVLQFRNFSTRSARLRLRWHFVQFQEYYAFREIASHCATYYRDPRSRRSLRLKKVRQNVTTAKSYLSSSKRARTHLPTIAFIDKSINRRKWKTRIRTYIFYLTTTHVNRHSEVMFAVPSLRQQMFPILLPVLRSPRWLSCRRHTKPGAEKKFKLSCR